MASFYRKMLEEEEAKRDAAVRAAAASLSKNERKEVDVVTEPETTREKKLADEARRINQLGTDAIALNEEGQVVDKRQLLKGGLNVLASKKQTPTQVSGSEYQAEYEARRNADRQKVREREARARQRLAVEEQYAQTRKRAVDAEAEMEEEIRLRAKSKKTETDVLGARERYLARKRAAAL